MKKQIVSRRLIVVVLFAAVVGIAAWISNRQAEPEPVSLLTEEEAQSIALEALDGGRVIRCERYYREDTWIYRIDVLDQTRQTKIEVDAVTGVIRSSTSQKLEDMDQTVIQSESSDS